MENSVETEAVCLVYSTYKRNMQSAGTPYDKPLFHDMQHWAHTAKIVLKNNIDPVRFVNAQFMVLGDGLRGTLTPRMLHTPAKRALNAYLATCPDPCDYAGGLAMMRRRLTMMARGPHTAESVLSNPNNPFPAWFRIAAAPVLTDKLKSRYLESAMEEYVRDMRLRNFLIKEELHGRFDTVDGRSDVQ